MCAYCREAELKGRKLQPRVTVGICPRCERQRRLLNGLCPKCREMTRQGRVPYRSAEWRQKIGDAQRGAKNHAYKGGRHIDKNGYVWVLAEGDPIAEAMVTSTKGYVQEHRLVMARSLGRPLQSGETVHHINGIRWENGLTNLQLRRGQHGKGIVLTCRACGSHDLAAEPLADFMASHSAAV